MLAIWMFLRGCQRAFVGRGKGVVVWLWILAFSFLPAAGQEAQGVIFGRDVTKLSPQAQRMRQAILQAVTSGQIESLRVPIEMNELKPVFSPKAEGDPIAYLKSVSGDGNGREMLAVLFNLLTTGYAITGAGTKSEMVIWPYHAVLPPDKLTPAQEVELYRFVPPARLKEMISKGKYDYFSVGISKDGVWHYFKTEN